MLPFVSPVVGVHLSPSIIVNVSPTSAETTGSGTILTTNSVTCSVTGGTVTSRIWSFTDGGTDITIVSPTSATTTFRQSGGGSGEYTGTARQAVTVNGVTYNSPDVFVSIVRT